MDISQKKIAKFEEFINKCKKDPSIIHTQEFAFFKNYLLSIDSTIPIGEKTKTTVECIAEKTGNEDAKNFETKEDDANELLASGSSSDESRSSDENDKRRERKKDDDYDSNNFFPRLAKFKRFISKCKKDPSVIHMEKFAFFKNYLISINATTTMEGKIEKASIKKEKNVNLLVSKSSSDEENERKESKTEENDTYSRKTDKKDANLELKKVKNVSKLLKSEGSSDEEYNLDDLRRREREKEEREYDYENSLPPDY